MEQKNRIDQDRKYGMGGGQTAQRPCCVCPGQSKRDFICTFSLTVLLTKSKSQSTTKTFFITSRTPTLLKISLTIIYATMILQDTTPTLVGEATEGAAHAKKQKQSNNVWYRSFLKPFIRETRPTYKDAFRGRIVQTVGVPVDEIEGLHAIFKADYRQYSPLQGLIFSYNHFVNNLYRYGDKEREPAVALIQELFHVLPGGDIQPTHAGRNSGSHLTPSLIGDVFEELERMKSKSQGEKDFDTIRQKLSGNLAGIINKHVDYQLDTNKLQEDVRKAEVALEELHQKEEDATEVRQRIKVLEGDVIKANRHHIKRLKKDLKKADPDRRREIEADIQQRTEQNDQTELELAELRTKIVTSLDFKVARKILKRAQDAADLERESRVSIANIITKSFCTYEFDFPDVAPANLPKFSTTAILLSFLWRKYDSISAFERYFESMSRMNALNVSFSAVQELLNKRSSDSYHSSDDNDGSVSTSHSTIDPNTSLDSDCDNSLRHHRGAGVWSPATVEKATRITTGNPGNNDRPAVIVFSYVTWAAYSEFPDCGETALRNLFNQLVYNPDIGKFDNELLVELKEKYYPDMSQLLIDYYKKNDKPQDSSHSTAAVEWIDVVSRLNSLRARTKDSALQIKYRRDKEEQNLASPLRNALKVVNALFGVDDVDGAMLVRQIADQINELRDLELTVDLSGVKDDGFGILALTADGKVRYELQSYKPVHFGFVQSERLNNNKSVLGAGRRDFRAFRRLMRHSNLPPRASFKDLGFFEQLALASLFVPYKLKRDTVGRFFRNVPAHYALLFVDFDSQQEKQQVLKWVKSHPEVAQDNQVRSLLDRIEAYVEPEFAPQKKEKNKADSNFPSRQ